MFGAVSGVCHSPVMTDECAHSETTAHPPDWDARAAGFDDEPDHGLRDPAVRAARAARLRSWLPGHLADVLDLGCGTGGSCCAPAAGSCWSRASGASRTRSAYPRTGSPRCWRR
ncbi:hypothetical protein GCM10023100_61460 [Actinocorallia cavernae]|uniref:Methyltransferase family protein n=2 Tax=Actinomycetes TaxID=1760 RepID=A0ABP8T554_9ACTN